MRKAIIEVVIETQDDQDEFNKHLNGPSAYLALEEILIYFRNILKYEESISEDSRKYIKCVQKQLFEILEDRNIKL